GMTGSEIAEWRKKNKWSQTQVARAVGTDQSIVSKWERGLMQPPDDIRVQLTAALAKKQRAYEKAGGMPAAAPLPELKGRNAYDNAAERNWRNEQHKAYTQNNAIHQAAELAAGARMDEIRKELEEEKEMKAEEKVNVPEKMRFDEVKKLMFAMFAIKDSAESITDTAEGDVAAVLELAEKELARRMEPGVI
ncbi:helix-turn-helix domain-containing protein, partial [Faecalibaculum rodentium]|uniref:helix-turn-helix domain-containing protein n=2 Tax=Faecalibaculum rodentium TaxID=1702221 RepID=UPI0025B77060